MTESEPTDEEIAYLATLAAMRCDSYDRTAPALAREVLKLRAKLAEAEDHLAFIDRTYAKEDDANLTLDARELASRARLVADRDAAIARAEKADAAYATLADGCVAIATERDAARASEARLREVLNSIAFGEINATSADDAIDQVRDYALRALAAEQEPKA